MQIVIEVWRGLVQAIYADTTEIEVIVADRDCQAGEGVQCHTLTPACLGDLPEAIQKALPRRTRLIWNWKEEEQDA